MRLPRLGADPASPFPPLHAALREPDGLLAAGGDLSPQRLLNAYRAGIFPWFSPGEPILWWSPDPRVVFDTASFALPRRFRRELRRSEWTLSADTGFEAVMRACAEIPRRGQDGGSWIGAQMLAAYGELHRLGHAHSIEVRDGGELVGGLYGVAIGRMFFGESMFSARPGGSKVALAALARVLAGWGWPLLDAQVGNPHLLALGARELPRAEFAARVAELSALPGRPGPWTAAFAGMGAAALAT
jgi:leucyl/phenylalanyl-tRNA--protein transferase